MNRATFIIAAFTAAVCVNEAYEASKTVETVAVVSQQGEEESMNQPEQPQVQPPSGPELELDGGYRPVVEAEHQYADLFRTCGAEHGIDAALLAAVAHVESSYRPGAVSHKGAQGLMQFMPATAASMKVDPWDPASAICGTAQYLSTSFGIHGDWDKAIAAYNAGDPVVTRKGASAADGSYVADVQTQWAARRSS